MLQIDNKNSMALTVYFMARKFRLWEFHIYVACSFFFTLIWHGVFNIPGMCQKLKNLISKNEQLRKRINFFLFVKV